MPQPRIDSRQTPSRPNQAIPPTTSIGPSEQRQLARRHEDAHPLADLRAGHLGDHGRRGRVEGRDADPGHEEHQRQRRVGRRKAEATEHRRGDGWRQDDEIAHADPVGQIADEGVEQAGQLREDRQAAGRRHSRCPTLTGSAAVAARDRAEGIVDHVSGADGEHLVGLEPGDHRATPRPPPGRLELLALS